MWADLFFEVVPILIIMVIVALAVALSMDDS